MRLVLAAVGRKDPFADITGDYLKRASQAGAALGLSGPDLKVVEAPRAMSGNVRQAREAELLAEAVPDRARVVVLDERGKDMSSRAFANLIARERELGSVGLAFMIGGADGFSPAFKDTMKPQLAARLAFGQATWPHMLVRLMLAEQVYRATTILTNHPYHRD